MLIGIDLLGVQSPEGRDREAGRHGRQLVGALLARDPVNRYVLYAHDGFPTDGIPSARDALRVSLAPIAGHGPTRLRPTIQRLLDRNPDGLDWLVLLDPFGPEYGGLPPEAPLNGLKVASVVHDLPSSVADDRCLVPLRRHDAVLAVSEATADVCRRKLGSASWRVSALGVACDASFAATDGAEPVTKVTADELGRLGISGPFLLASVSGGPTRANLFGILEAYHRLPVEHRKRYQLAIVGQLPDPWGVVGFLHKRGCAEGLVLVGEVGEETLRTLYGRCSAFVSPSIDEGTGLSLVEAMRCGAAVVAGRAGAQPDIVGDAGLIADPASPSEIAGQVSELLADVDLARELRRKARARSARHEWGPVVDSLLAILRGDSPRSSGPRYRFDRGHVARPRIAVFPAVLRGEAARLDLAAQVPPEWREAYNVDLYLEPDNTPIVDGLPSDIGGFDSRQFDRNDGILSYHAVAYHVAEARALETSLVRLRARPGLVFLLDDEFLDLIGPESLEDLESPDDLPTGPPSRRRPKGRDPRGHQAASRLREVFLTASRVVVRSPRHLDRIKAAMPEFADQVVEIPPPSLDPAPSVADRDRARARLDLLPDSLVVGQFGGLGGLSLTAESFEAVARNVPGALLLSFDRKGGATSEDEGRTIAVVDLAIHLGDTARGSVTLLDLLRAGVPTIALDADYPHDVVRKPPASADTGVLARIVLELAADPEARAALGRSARAYCSGVPDPARASTMLVGQLERCAAELPRGPGRRRHNPAGSPRKMATTPHSLRPASPTDEAVSRLR